MPAEAIAKAFKRRSSARRARSRITALQTPFAPDAAASTATRPNVRDDGQRPSSRDGMAGVVGVIWVSREAEYFCGRGWTGQISLKSLRKFVLWRADEVHRVPLSRICGPWLARLDRYRRPAAYRTSSSLPSRMNAMTEQNLTAPIDERQELSRGFSRYQSILVALLALVQLSHHRFHDMSLTRRHRSCSSARMTSRNRALA